MVVSMVVEAESLRVSVRVEVPVIVVLVDKLETVGSKGGGGW